MSVKIFVMTHKAFTPPEDAMYVPLQVGRKENGDLGTGYLGDDTGENISDLNHLFGELTGLYWIWQNYDGPEQYIGINHYRRYFVNGDGEFLSESEIGEILRDHDIIASETIPSERTYREVYAEAHNIRDLEEVGRSIQKLYPEYRPDFECALSMDRIYSANLMVMERQQYNAYCRWLFEILFDASEHIDVTGYDLYHARVFGFLSEGMLTVWALHHGLDVYEASIGYTDEKAETRELKAAVARLLEMKQYRQAQELFNQVMTARPDISLPMSDIRREIPLIQQILYIGNEESRQGKQGLFAQSDDLKELMDLYGRFYASLQILGQEDDADTKESDAEKELVFLRENGFTDVAFEVMLHYDMYQKYKTPPLNEERLRRVFQAASADTGSGS